jgi:phosphate starvation-inducible protein PhoH and related proteins
VITGDITQVDLPKGTKSGLGHVIEVLKDVPGISFTHFHAQGRGTPPAGAAHRRGL